MSDSTSILRDQVAQAAGRSSPLRIVGGNSKHFYGNPQPCEYETLKTGIHSGVMDYAPEELMLRVRAGTPLAEVKSLLGQEGQMLGFEPPDFGGNATMGGVVAAGLSGPRRPSAGSVRDFVLGITLLTGDATVLSFGGQVMKNVAGYDVSRLMTGAMGTLGVILDISLKVLPRPGEELTWCRRADAAADERLLGQLRRNGLGLSATATVGDRFYVRASAEADVEGDVVDGALWDRLANQQLSAFEGGNLWRISVPRTAPTFMEQAAVVEWEGALRWLLDPAEDPRQTFAGAGVSGHATLFRSDEGDRDDRFHPLDPLVGQIHRRLKQQFDPVGIFNPGRVNWYSNAN